MTFENPFTGEPIDAEPPAGFDADTHGLDLADTDYWEQMADELAAPACVHEAWEDLEACAECGNALALARALDAADPRFMEEAA